MHRAWRLRGGHPDLVLAAVVTQAGSEGENVEPPLEAIDLEQMSRALSKLTLLPLAVGLLLSDLIKHLPHDD